MHAHFFPYAVNHLFRHLQIAFSFLFCLFVLNACGGGSGTVGIATGSAFYTTAPSTITIPIGTITYTVGGGTGPYRSSSSNTTVATTSVKGSSLTIIGVAAGTAQISAMDAIGATININVTVGSGASTTALYTTVPGPITLTPGMSSTYTIGGGKPGYMISSSNPAVAATGINGNSFVISGISAGSAQIAVFDAVGTAVSVSVVVGAGGAAQTLFVSAPSAITSAVGETGSFNIGGGVAPYTVTSSNNSVVTTAISGNTLKLTGIAKGNAQALVFDAKGTSVTIAVTVDPGSATIPLFTAAPSAITMTPGSTNTYAIAGGVASYTATSSNTAVAKASVSSGIVSITSVAAGDAHILIFDATGASVTISVTVTVGGSAIPLFTAAPSSIALAVAASATYTVGGGNAPYSATSSNIGAAKASVSGNTLTVTGLISGSAQILVFDSAGASVSITATVGSGGVTSNFYTAAPSAITTTTGIGSSYAIGGGTAPYTVSSSNAGVASASVVGTTLNVNSVGVGNAQILVFDATGTSITITITVISGGSGIALFTAAPSTVTMAISATNAYPIGGGTAPYTVSSSNTSVANTSIVAGKLSVTAISIGSAQIHVFDSTGTSVSITINVSSGGTSLPLFTAAPSNITMTVGATGNYTVGGGSSPYTVTTGNAGVARGSISGNTLTITSVATGSAQILVFDASGASVPINVTVSPGSSTTALYTAAPSNVTMTSGSPSIYAVGGGTAPYTVTSSNIGVATGSITGSALTVNGIAPGSAQILVFDATGSSVSIAITVISGGTNTPLFTAAPSAITMATNTVSTYAIGGGTAPYTVTSSNTGVVQGTITGSANNTLTITSFAAGSAQILVFDATGTSVLIVATVSANGNNLPLFTAAPSILTMATGVTNTYTIGGGTAPYTVTSSNAAVATASNTPVGTTLTIHSVVAGSAQILVFDATGASVTITVAVNSATTTTALFTTASNNVNMSIGAVGVYTIGGGTAPYSVSTSNAGVATATVSAGTTLTINSITSGTAQILVSDANGTAIAIQVSITQAGTVLIDIQPSAATGNVGDVLSYQVSGGVAPYTVSVNNISIATVGTPTVATSGGSFAMTLLNAGDTIITVRDALGQTKTTVLTSVQRTTDMRLSPSALAIAEDNFASIVLNIFGGTAPYRAFTDDETLTSVSTSGATLTIGLGTNLNRCVNVVDSSNAHVSNGIFIVKITVVDSLGASATMNVSIKDNGIGTGIVSTQPAPFAPPCT